MPFSVLCVRDRILSAGFLVLRTREGVRVGRGRAEEFYHEHRR